MKKWVALMPLRGGSKSIPKKNIKIIAGRPLFYWALSAAIESRVFSEVAVSTDSDEIEAAVLALFPGATIHRRSPATATDEASTESVMLEYAESNHFDYICLIQATSPLTSAEDFRRAHQRFEAEEADSLLTAVEFRRFLWKPDNTPINYDPIKRPRRQDFAPWMLENGAFYFTRRNILLEQKSRLGGKISTHIMSSESAAEIDEPCDWEQVESLLLQKKRMPQVQNIKLLVVDVDGTLTDGGMYYGADGELLKRFDTRDWNGLKLVEQAGVPVCIMTAEDSPAVHARLKKVPLSYYRYGIKDKVSELNRLLGELDLSWEEAGFIGDDLGDLDCLKKVGFAACPADAVKAVKAVVDFECQRTGGHSAVREVCDLIISPSITNE